MSALYLHEHCVLFLHVICTEMSHLFIHWMDPDFIVKITDRSVLLALFVSLLMDSQIDPSTILAKGKLQPFFSAFSGHVPQCASMKEMSFFFPKS